MRYRLLHSIQALVFNALPRKGNLKMMDSVNLPLIMVAAFVASASPGPATLAIATTSMNYGRKHGLAIAAGITSGSFTWSISAALGLGAIMAANAWAFEIIRYFGACYLLYLAYKSARSALNPAPTHRQNLKIGSLKSAYAKGLALHLTNPKAVLFFGSLYAIGLPINTPPIALVMVIAAIGLQSIIVFHGYALLFSSPPMVAVYERMKRGFDTVFALAFGVAGVKILSAQLERTP